MKRSLARRSLLRGMVGGGAISVALPFLDCFLDENGTALAAGKAPLPVRFGTWFWGCGITPERWTPTRVGTDYDIPVEMKPIEPFKSQVTILSGFGIGLDGATNHPHITGNTALRTGAVPARPTDVDAPSLDILISDAIGGASRFRSLELACTGDAKVSYSMRSASVRNPSEVSPLSVYARIFGPEFQDPNAAVFKPDPRIMTRLSVLSAVKEDRRSLMAELGVRDRARLDEYFTALRQTEQQLELQLQKPPPAEACAIPKKANDSQQGTEIEQVAATHRLMTALLAMALACNQTRVFNMVFSPSTSSLRRSGESTNHHQLTHEELVDTKLGYQPQSTWFVERSLQAWGGFLQVLASIREGDGTLLDNCLVLGHSDCSLAKTHSVMGIPLMLSGRAGGRVRAGMHIVGNGDPITRVGLTLQQVMGVSVSKWGSKSLQTSKNISEILA